MGIDENPECPRENPEPPPFRLIVGWLKAKPQTQQAF
jgi:hypothetical protein